MPLSLSGLVVALTIFAPSFLLIPFPARHPLERPPHIPRFLTFLERAGQGGCLVAVALTGNDPTLDVWLLTLTSAIAIYYGLWLRYFATGRHFAALYAPLGWLPVPMAVLPVVAFLGAALWLNSWWIAAAAVVLAVGHVGASLLIASTVSSTPTTG